MTHPIRSRTPGRWRAWAPRQLATQILVWVLCLMVVTVATGGLLVAYTRANDLDRQYELRALGIASTVAQMPAIAAALADGDPQHQIQALAGRVMAGAHPSYVVVTDRFGTRYSHPNPALIGQKLEEPVAVLDGQTHLGIDPGSLGRSANAKAPILDAQGRVIGQVSVGILETTERAELVAGTWAVVGFSAVVLALGAIGSLLLARRIKRVTFDLEPAEIASLLQEREALLHGIREAMIGTDDDGRITAVNEEARRLLGLEGTVIGSPLASLVPEGRLRDLLTGKVGGSDEVVLTEDAVLVINRMPVQLAGRSIGHVVTLRDRTEPENLGRDLQSAHGLMNALRVQEHEYANRLHVVAGLLEIGDTDTARGYLAQIAQGSATLAESLRARFAAPELAALLVAKTAVAAEQDVAVVVADGSHLEDAGVELGTVLTIVGNLVDNGVDAVAGAPGGGAAERTVTVLIDDTDGLFISVQDTGPGIPVDRLQDVLTDGYSTKPARPGIHRGVGLALINRLVRRHNGTLDVFAGPGGHVEVWLPTGARAPASAGTLTMEEGTA